MNIFGIRKVLKNIQQLFFTACYLMQL